MVHPSGVCSCPFPKSLSASLTFLSRLTSQLLWRTVAVTGYFLALTIRTYRGKIQLLSEHLQDTQADIGATFLEPSYWMTLWYLLSWIIFVLPQLAVESQTVKIILALSTTTGAGHKAFKMSPLHACLGQSHGPVFPNMFAWIFAQCGSSLAQARHARNIAMAIARCQAHRSHGIRDLLTGRFGALLSGRFHS
jgi:hypothetical protein